MFNESGTTPVALPAEPVHASTIPCPACGVEIPLVQRGRLLVARHACLKLPERDVYEENPPEPEPVTRTDGVLSFPSGPSVVGGVAAPVAEK
jgi:predicted RNA-binding Zn-ribbon protein involved in translation (DUF1610 family)